MAFSNRTVHVMLAGFIVDMATSAVTSVVRGAACGQPDGARDTYANMSKHNQHASIVENPRSDSAYGAASVQTI